MCTNDWLNQLKQGCWKQKDKNGRIKHFSMIKQNYICSWIELISHIISQHDSGKQQFYFWYNEIYKMSLYADLIKYPLYI